MGELLRAIETTGRVVDARHIETATELPVGQAVRLVVLLPEADGDEFSEAEWREMAAHSAAYAFLADPEEDVYTLEDGKPLELDE